MKNNKKGYQCLKTDSDGHWYLISVNDAEHFDALLAKTEEPGNVDACECFDSFYFGNRVNPHNLLIPKGAKER